MDILHKSLSIKQISIYSLTIWLLLSCTQSVIVTSVFVQPSSISINKGQSGQISARVFPEDADQTVTWESLDKSIATVTDGVVTAISSGTTRITASAGGKTGYCAVTVTVDATSITLNKETLTLEKGNSETLLAKVTPDDATCSVSWTSSDSKVATVSDNGEVKALSKGRAIITARAGDRYTKCTVNVVVPLQSLKFSEESELFIDDIEPHTIHVIPVPEDATVFKYEWEFDENILSAVDSVHSSSVKIKALNNGETEVRVRAVGTDVVASNYVKIKVKATSFSVGFMEYSHKYGCYKWYDVSPYYSYETTQNSPLNLAFDFKPEIAYVDDAEVV